MFPVPAALCLQSRADKITIVDDSYILDYYSKQLETLYGFNVVHKSPLFDDIQNEIDNSDLIVYHDSEFLVPLDLFHHKHKDKDAFIMNTYEPRYKHCINYTYSKEDLAFIYPMKELYGAGEVPFVNYQDTRWIYGKLDD